MSPLFRYLVVGLVGLGMGYVVKRNPRLTVPLVAGFYMLGFHFGTTQPRQITG